LQERKTLFWRNVAMMIALVVSTAHGFCSEPAQSYSMRVWEIRNGLPDEVIQSFSQTRDKFLWIGTTTGLLRFDGAQFTPFDQSNTPALAARSVFCLSVTRDGTLWIGTEGGGLVQYRDAVFRAFSSKDGLTNNVVRAVLEDHLGQVWIGTDDGLFKFSAGHFVREDGGGSVPRLAVHTLMEDTAGRLWAGGSSLISIQNGVAKEYSFPGTNRIAGLKSILETRDGDILFGGVTGLYRLRNGDRFEKIPNVGGTVRTLKQTSNGDLWIGTIGEGLFLWQSGERSPERFGLKMPSEAILNFFEDSEKNLWIGTQAGLVRLTPSRVGIEPLAIAASSDFGSVFQDTDGTLSFCSRYLYRSKGGSFERINLPNMAQVTVRNLLRARDGALWVGTEGKGTFRLWNGHITRFSTAEGAVSDFVRVMMQAHDGSMWIGTDSGATHIESTGIKNYEAGPGDASVMALLENPDRSVWLGSFRGLAHIRQGHRVEDLLTQALAMKVIWALHRDTTGALWIGTSEGLYRWKDGALSHLTAETGLASDLVYQILDDHSGNLWLSCPDGVAQYGLGQLNQAAEGKLKHVSPKFLTRSDEIGSAEFFGTIQPAGVINKEGVLWFPSNKGVVYILPSSISPVQPFPIVIAPISADGRKQAKAAVARLRASITRVDISFTPILLGPQDRIRLYYKLDGLEGDWQDAGSSRTVSYTNLAPGNYRFHVRAVRLIDEVVIAESSIDFVKEAYFYQSWWFYVLCVIALALLLWQIYRHRIGRMRNRFQIVLEERGRVAREMHDTVLQGCSSISALLDASASVAPDDPDAARELSAFARKQLEITVDDTRRAIWNLRQYDRPGDSLRTGLERIVDEAKHEFDIRVQLVNDHVNPSLPSVTLHEVLMVVREAVRNAGLHAGASLIIVRARVESDGMVIEVSDDGRGFVVHSEGQLPSQHYGIRGMYERMQSIGGSLFIKSKAGEGALVVLHVNSPNPEVRL
jgi:ligand-binding sensor domain-containing protein/signal transduction histidine kinase